MKLNEWRAFVEFHQGVCPWCHKILKEDKPKACYMPADVVSSPNVFIPMLLFCNQRCLDKWQKKYK